MTFWDCWSSEISPFAQQLILLFVTETLSLQKPKQTKVGVEIIFLISKFEQNLIVHFLLL